MYLNNIQEKMLAGEYGWAVKKAMEIIVKVGESFGAEKLVEIAHAHVSGVSYSNIGEAGLEFLKEFVEKGGRVRVYSTINPGCIDLSGESRVIDKAFYEKQVLINNILREMGFQQTYTCIPYIHRVPKPGEHLSWSESSAVIYANSIFGARTNREGGPLALASAITGYTYYAGLHVLENRRVRYIVDIGGVGEEYYGALGLWLGYNLGETPYLTNHSLNHSVLKIMLAASAASGSHALVVLDKLTPKNTYLYDDRVEKMSVEEEMLDKYIGDEPSGGDKVLGYIGCPHLDPYEFRFIARLFRIRRVREGCALLVSIPASYMDHYWREIVFLRNRGVDVAVGTCPVVSKIVGEYDVVATNSGKAVYYLSRLHGLKTYLASLEKVIEIVSV